jgi:hypothetical protein
MAFVTRPSAQLTYGMVDASGSRSTAQFDIPYGTLAAVALAAADVLRPLIGAMTGCTIVSQSITYSSVDNAPAAAAANSRVERKGVFTFLTAAGKSVHYAIPSFLFSLEKTSGAINEDYATVQAFVNGVVGADVIFCDSNGVDLTQYKGAREASRKTTREQLPRDYFPDADIVP